VPTVTRPQLAVYVAAAIAIALLGARYLHQSQGASAGRKPAAGRTSPSVRIDAAGGGTATVQVVGAVRRPGLYRVRASGRINDAVRRAGGPTPKADLAGLNLAARVSDGQQIVVPAAGAAGPAGSASGAAAGAAGGAGSAAGAAATGGGQPLNLNTASAEQLDTLDGVGPATAQKIVAYRQQHGGFRSVTELDQVPGIGEKKLAALKDRLRV
jgi:competence protein ComEA